MDNTKETKPVISKEDVKRLLEENYGLSTVSIMNLESENDCNFRIKVEKLVDSCKLDEILEDGYILKILNTTFSEFPQHIGKCN